MNSHGGDRLGRVLVVDDDPAVCSIGAALFGRLGYAAESALGGEEGLEKFTQDLEGFDLVMLDLTMPGMSGEDCFVELRKLSPSIPVIITSGLSELDVASRFDATEGVLFLQKPYRSGDLQQTVDQLMTIG